MQTRILAYLKCPKCRTGSLNVRVAKEENDRVKEGTLHCEGCHKKYPIHNFIPSFVSNIYDKQVVKTVESFGYEWNHFAERLGPLKDKFLIDIPPIQESFFKDKIILDVGCGMGRLARLSSLYGASEVFACDMSSSVNAAYHYTKDLNNVHVIQADLHHLPFTNSFDFIYCLGVLHHIPDGFRGFSSIASRLKEDGTIAIWVYSKEGNGLLRLLMLPIQTVSSRLGYTTKYLLSIICEFILRFIYKIIYYPINSFYSLEFLKKNLYYNDYFRDYFFGPHHNTEDRRSVIFDFMSTKIIHYISSEEIKSWFSKNHFESPTLTFLRNQSWGAVGQKKISREK